MFQHASQAQGPATPRNTAASKTLSVSTVILYAPEKRCPDTWR